MAGRVAPELHLISRVPTPHNDNLMAALDAAGCCRLSVYYSVPLIPEHPWKDPRPHGGPVPSFIGTHRPHLRLLWYAVSRKSDRFFLIGWPNLTSRLLLVIFWFLRRHFFFWCDFPEPRSDSGWRGRLSSLAFSIVKKRAEKIFVVGNHTLRHFESAGFPSEKLRNLPIFVEPSSAPIDRDEIGRRYSIEAGAVLLVAGSRLLFNKGYDVLVEAVAEVAKRTTIPFRLVIVGDGPERDSLGNLVDSLGLNELVVFERWLDPGDFEGLVSAADVFVHPARFDAFGGGTLIAMALGVPVVGTDGAGAVLERVVDRKSGRVVPKDDAAALASALCDLIDDEDQRKLLGDAAMSTAREWHPAKGAEIICAAISGTDRLR